MKKEQMTIKNLFDTSKTIASRMLDDYTYPWEVLPHMGEIIRKLGTMLPESEYKRVGNYIWIHKAIEIPPTACMKGPLIICQGAELRTGCFIRGNVIIGSGAVVGNSTELKNTILFDGVQVPHYNYVGDSILGYKAHMGAGSLTSNVKSDKALVKVHAEDGDIETNLKKFGAMLGDFVEVGCNSVLNPGTVIGRNSNIYPLSSVRGCVNENSIFKKQDDIVVKQ